MAHDRNGTKLHVDDIVLLTCRVTGVDEHEEFINVHLETLDPVYPAGHKRNLLVNAKQVELALSKGRTETDIDVLHAVEDAASKSGEIST